MSEDTQPKPTPKPEPLTSAERSAAFHGGSGMLKPGQAASGGGVPSGQWLGGVGAPKTDRFGIRYWPRVADV